MKIRLLTQNVRACLAVRFPCEKTVTALGMGHLTSWLVEGIERDSGSLSLLWIVNRLCYN